MQRPSFDEDFPRAYVHRPLEPQCGPVHPRQLFGTRSVQREAVRRERHVWPPELWAEHNFWWRHLYFGGRGYVTLGMDRDVLPEIRRDDLVDVDHADPVPA